MIHLERVDMLSHSKPDIKEPRIAIAGATGRVGATLTALLAADSIVLAGNSRTITSRASLGPMPDGSATRPGNAQPASKFASTTAENAACASLDMVRSAGLGRILVQAAGMRAQRFTCNTGGAHIVLAPELDHDLKRQSHVAILGK